MKSLILVLISIACLIVAIFLCDNHTERVLWNVFGWCVLTHAKLMDIEEKIEEIKK